MNRAVTEIKNVLRKQASETLIGSGLGSGVQQWRGIRVKVQNGNLEQALQVMQRKMRVSGVERLLKNQETRHIKNSEKRVLARKTLECRLRSQDLAKKLKSILLNKVRGL